MEHDVVGLDPVSAIALVGVLGVGAQWLAWRYRMPAIVLMLGAGILIGPVSGVLDPMRDIGPLTSTLISLAVAVILFEGGLTLDLRKLADARRGVLRLVLVGAPLGWLLSSLALHYIVGLGWESAAVFGGIMIVTGPTVIAPLLRQARLARRPAQLLQWEAIVNDPIGALVAVLAFGLVLVSREVANPTEAAQTYAIGIGFAAVVGFVAGYILAWAFWRGRVPEYMKVPVLFVAVIAVFALTDHMLHESGLLAVTVMGLVIANADLPSFVEIRRFKEHATTLLVSGVFILLAAQMDFAALGQLTWRAAAFVVAVIVLVRPLTVLLSLLYSDVPRNERLLIALTGPRGVVLVSVAGLFGTRLSDAGVADGALVGPLAFVLVLGTVIVHGFTLAPVARALGLAGADAPGLLLVGGSRFTTALGEALHKAEVPVLICDPNRNRLLRPRHQGLPVFHGDILAEAAEQGVEFVSYSILVAASDNDAYNTLLAADLAPEFGRENTFQLARRNAENPRHALPTQLTGRGFANGRTFDELEAMMAAGWTVRITSITEAFSYADWQARRPDGIPLARIEKGGIRLLRGDGATALPAGTRLVALVSPDDRAAADAAA